MRTLSLLMRAAVSDNAQALHDANAITILRQQIRDAAGALGAARRELAVAMAHRAGEERALAALDARLDALTAGARAALADGREHLGGEAAILIAALEDEREHRRAAGARLAAEIERLGRIAAGGADRLRDLDRGLRLARATEALRRAGLDGRSLARRSAGALGEAERTLARLRDRQAREDDLAEALAGLEAEAATEGGIEAGLAAAGYGARPRTDPGDVLARLRAQA